MLHRPVLPDVGPTLVRHALGYLTAARDGLSEAEMLDVLSLDDEVAASLHGQHEQGRAASSGGILRVPAVAWTRVRMGLGRLVVEHHVGDTSLLRWRHAAVAEVAQARFLLRLTPATERRMSTASRKRNSSSGSIGEVHGGGIGSHNVGEFSNVTTLRAAVLAEYFEGRWAGKGKPLPAAGEAVLLDRLAPAQPVILQTTLAASVTVAAGQKNQIGINTRKLRELPGHLVACGRAADFVNSHLTTAEWVAAKIHVLSVHELLGDFEAAQRGGYNKDHLSFRFIRNAVLASYRSVVTLQMGSVCSQLGARLMQFVDQPAFPACTRLADSCLYHWPGSLAQTVLEKGACIQPNKGWACLPGAGNAEECVLETGAKAVNCCALNADGSRVFIGAHTGAMRVLDVHTGEQLIGIGGASDRHGTQEDNTSAITAIIPSHNGKLVVTGHVGGNLKLWDMRQGRLYMDIKAHSKMISSLAVSIRDVLVSGSEDGNIQIRRLMFNLRRESRRKSMKTVVTGKGAHGPISAVTLALHEEFCVSGTETGVLQQWNVKTGKSMRTMEKLRSPIYALLVPPTCDSVFAGYEGASIAKFSLETGDVLQEFGGFHEYFVCLAFSKSAKFAIAACPDGAQLKISLEDGEVANGYYGSSVVDSICVDDGCCNAVTGTKDETVVGWNVEMPNDDPDIWGHAGGTNFLVVNPATGVEVASHGNDNPCEVWIWERTCGNTLGRHRHKGGV